MNDAGGSFCDSSGAVVRPPIAWPLRSWLGSCWILSIRCPSCRRPCRPAGWALLCSSPAWDYSSGPRRPFAERARESRPSKLRRRSFDKGPYRYSRNPIYVGMFLGLIGLSVSFDSL
nr:phosphatidylethanolamine N-methyltransferase family protein [Sinorhizobium meliloti]